LVALVPAPYVSVNFWPAVWHLTLSVIREPAMLVIDGAAVQAGEPFATVTYPALVEVVDCGAVQPAGT